MVGSCERGWLLAKTIALKRLTRYCPACGRDRKGEGPIVRVGDLVLYLCLPCGAAVWGKRVRPCPAAAVDGAEGRTC